MEKEEAEAISAKNIKIEASAGRKNLFSMYLLVRQRKWIYLPARKVQC